VRRSVQDIFQQSPLDLRFALQKTLDPRITHTRASSATFVDSSGVLRSAVTNLLLRSEEFETTWTSTALLAFGSGSITNAIAAPNGTITADKIVEDTTTSTHNVSQAYTASIAVVPHTISFYVKAAERTAVSIWLRGTSSGNRYEVGFNLANGTVRGSSLQGNFTSGSESIQSVGNGWFRCTATATPGASETSMRLTIFLNNSPSLSTNNPSYTGDGTSGIYLWGAQLEQASTVGDYVPTTSAINSAPRFDHNPTTGESLGLLPEEPRTNSLTYSEDTSQWLTPTNITLSQNQTTAPDGASTADQYLETAATGLHVQDGMPFTFVTSTVYTYSVFVKSIGGRNFEIGYPPTIFTNRFARFNLSGSGSVQGSDAGVTASIQAYANGWYRCSATNTCASGSSSRIGNFIINDSFSRSYAGDVTKGLFIWGAQLEAGAFPTSYIPTTTATATRAADVASITGANFGTTRTNLATYSQTLNNAAWTLSGTGATITATTDIAAPDGSMTGWTLTCGAGGFAQIQQIYTGTSGVAYTGSFWIRRRSGTNTIAIRVSENINTTLTGVTSSWQRFNFTATSSSTTIRFGINLSGTTDSIDIWGAQLETGSAATPYIPTTTAAVSVFESSWYNQTEGTVFTHYSGQSGGRVFMSDDGTTNNRFEVRISANTSQLSSWSGGTQDVSGLFAPSATGLVDGVSVKTAVGLKVNDAAISTNGAAVGTDTSCAMPVALNRMILGSFQGSATFLNGPIRRLTFWPTRLGNTTLQQISQP
jgi:hypothetical protein